MIENSAESTLAAAFAMPPPGTRTLVIGFSGGLDSTVLLHWLATHRAIAICAIHVHHGLHPDADRWAQQCRSVCEALAVDLDIVRVHVANDAGEGVEAAARRARYAVFAAAVQAGDCLVTAHHQDDQAETVLLRLLRGSGSGGMAAMRALRPFGGGSHWRPLLDLPRAALSAYAEQHQLEWIDDPSNADARHDRNFLRQRVLPVLAQRWPHAGAAMTRSAALLAEQESLLDELTDQHLAHIQGVDPQTLSVAGLLAMPAAWRARVVRRWIDALHLPPLPATGVESMESQLLPARPDAQAEFRWHGAAIRRWRELLYAERLAPELPPDWCATWDGAAPLPLPTGGALELLRPSDCRPVAECAPFRVRTRVGGERITLPGRTHSHAVKIALQDAGVPPWQRKRLPWVFAADGDLLAVGDVLRSARAHAAGWRFRIDAAVEER